MCVPLPKLLYILFVTHFLLLATTFTTTAFVIGIHKGFKVGLGNGLLFGACFLTYALGFWYGGTLVADSVTRQCIPTLNDYNCISGRILPNVVLPTPGGPVRHVCIISFVFRPCA